MSRTDERFVAIGRVGNVHGLDGVVRIDATPDKEEFLRPESLLYLQNRRGDMVPVRVQSLRVDKKRNRQMFFVKFDRIASRLEAESYLDTHLHVDRKQFGREPSGSDTELSGYEVRDESGPVGIVSEVLDNPAHPILEITPESGTSDSTLLIPLVDAYIDRIDRENRCVFCKGIEPLKNL